MDRDACLALRRGVIWCPDGCIEKESGGAAAGEVWLGDLSWDRRDWRCCVELHSLGVGMVVPSDSSDAGIGIGGMGDRREPFLEGVGELLILLTLRELGRGPLPRKRISSMIA